jgi:gliding motility-associated-like protein
VNGSAFSTIATVNGNDTALIDSAIRCGHRYAYKVFAYGDEKQEISVSDTVIRIGFDSIAPERADIHKASITKTSPANGEVALLFDGAEQANRKGYIVYRAIANQAFQRIDTIYTNKRSNIAYLDSGLNTQYSVLRYYVRSFDSCGNIARPSDTHQTIHLEADAENAYNLLTWTRYRGWGDHSYLLQRRRGNNAWQTIATTDSATLSYRDSSVTCKRLYEYRILGREPATSYQGFSNTDTARAYENNAPVPPVIERASVTQTGTANGTVNVRWQASASADAQYYLLERRTGGSFELLDTLTNATSYTDTQRNTYERAYRYRLRVLDSCRNISDSFSTVHRTINLDAEGGNEANILNWTAYQGRNVQEYQILRGGQQLYTVPGNTTRLRDEKVVCDSFYRYRIRAKLRGGYTAYSNRDSAKAFDTKPPERIYLQRASVARFNDVVEVKWQASEAYDAGGYTLYRYEPGGAGFEQIATLKGRQQTSYRDTLAIGEQSRCYQVRVNDRCGNSSPLSNRGCIIRPEAEALDLKNQVVWPAYQVWRSGVRDYEVFKQVDSANYRSIGRADSSKRTFLDENLSDTADEFCYYIRARGWNTEEYAQSTRVCIAQQPVVHIPNSFSPATTPGLNDVFRPVGLYIQSYTMQVYNRWGQKVYSESKSEDKGWDGTHQGEIVPMGIYTYRIVVTGEDGSRKAYQGTLTVIR